MIRDMSQWPVNGRYDLAVMGAGPAGICAAVTAARRGLRVALVDRAGSPGGSLAQCGVTMFFGFGVDGHQVTGGLADEIVRRLDAAGAASLSINDYHETPEYRPVGDRELNSKVHTSPEVARVVFSRLLEEAGVDCLFYTHMADAAVEDGRIRAVLLSGLEGTYLLEAEVFADCTGDAQLCFLADPESVTKVPPEDGMHQSLFFYVGGVEPFDIDYNKKLYRELYEKGLVPDGVWEFFGFSMQLTPGVLGIGMCYAVGDAADSRDMTRMDRDLRERTLEMVEFLRKYMPGFRHCWLDQSAQRVGVRVSRSIRGEETITEDLLFSDTLHEPVALVWRDIGAHSNNRKFTADWARHLSGCGGVPMRTLLPRAFGNVVAAGRCISSEFRLSNTYRMMATCMATGEAAGLMVALSVKTGTPLKELRYGSLLPLMKENGFLLEDPCRETEESV